MSVSGRQVALAVQAMLTAATGRSCGYGTAPTTDDKPTGNAIPYSVLYELGQVAGYGPPFGDPDADAQVYVQISSVGTTAEQVSLHADKVRSAFLARVPGSGQFANPINVAGGRVMDRTLDQEDGTTVTSGTYTYVQRFALRVSSPAG
ncbi:hypothetical protein GCM10014715_39440 [Streptomyces spiralis]|uniref:DUF3168 domain-containing protein n=1 Tax=Streptomyces spiralis TaxID=66376 RepID=A0A919DUF5_9ACTN|nr:hypothetical protein [Streptomyces spiralis]GHE80174.1 hypothetical protein GCM10014715_39440 [Streptomyces spiralis]